MHPPPPYYYYYSSSSYYYYLLASLTLASSLIVATPSREVKPSLPPHPETNKGWRRTCQPPAKAPAGQEEEGGGRRY